MSPKHFNKEPRRKRRGIFWNKIMDFRLIDYNTDHKIMSLLLHEKYFYQYIFGNIK